MGSCQALAVWGCAARASPENRCNLRDFKVALCNKTLSRLGGGSSGSSGGILCSVSELINALIIFALINCKKSGLMGALDAEDAAAAAFLVFRLYSFAFCCMRQNTGCWAGSGGALSDGALKAAAAPTQRSAWRDMPVRGAWDQPGAV